MLLQNNGGCHTNTIGVFKHRNHTTEDINLTCKCDGRPGTQQSAE